MAAVSITFNGTINLDLGGEGIQTLLAALGASAGSLTVVDGEAVDNTAELVASIDDVDTSPAAVTAAEQLAAPTGWTLALAESWCEELAFTANGRLLHELPVAAGGEVSATEMRIAAGRPTTGTYALTGFTGGIKKRWAKWQGKTQGAASLQFPVTTVYDPEIKGRQTAKAFACEETIVPLFKIALANTRD